MRYKKIKKLVEEIIQPSLFFIKRSRGRSNTPFKEIELILNIFFPKTKHHESGKGYWKHVFVIHSGKKKLVLKMGRSKRSIQKDFTTYNRTCKRLNKRKANRYFAKIYWRTDLSMLQKYGRRVRIPRSELEKLKKVGESVGLKDIRNANIMKFGKQFRIVDAERK